MGKYRLIAGGHVQKDLSKPILDADGKPTGRYTAVQYRVDDKGKDVTGNGVIVESKTDLAKRWPEKFQAAEADAEASRLRVADLERQLAEANRLNDRLQAKAYGGLKVPGDPTPEVLHGSPAAAPGGQVSTGWQGGPPADVKAATAGKQAEQPKAPDRDLEAAWGDLEKMTVADLKALAEEEEIDLGGARTRDEIVKKIRAHG